MSQFTMLQADSHNVYRKYCPLNVIFIDGWARGLKPEQTIREASNAGYARCVVEPLIAKEWARLEEEFLRFEATNCVVPYTCIYELQQF